MKRPKGSSPKLPGLCKKATIDWVDVRVLLQPFRLEFGKIIHDHGNDQIVFSFSARPFYPDMRGEQHSNAIDYYKDKKELRQE
jgi:hypothetical protein